MLVLAGYPESVPRTTMTQLCGSGFDAMITGACAIKAGEAELVITGGVDNMSRYPFVMLKATKALSRDFQMEDTTIGWRFVNPTMRTQYNVRPMN